MKSTCFNLTVTIVVLLMAGTAHGQLGPAFSLDDNPQAPLTSPPGWIPGFGAEDPFGIGTYGGPWAPSPTLIAPPAMDGDILEPDPAGGPIPLLDVAMSPMYGLPFGYVDAVSDNQDQGFPKSAVIHIGFSVDRISMGMAGSAVGSESGFNQQPGDVYRTQSQFLHPINFAPMAPAVWGYNGMLPTAGVGGTNFMVFDESQLMLTPGLGVGNQIGPGVMCPAIGRGTHDNVDAANWQRFDTAPQDNNTDKWLYFSVNPDELTVSGAAAADVYVSPPNLPAIAAALYAPANQMGLFTGTFEADDIDGLVLWEDPAGLPGVVDPLVDYALFSLSHGSLSLSQYNLTESDVFFTNFQGGFWLYAMGMDLALLDAPGLLAGDNVDALEILIPGDANLDGLVDVQDFSILKASFGSAGGWLQANFNSDNIVDVQDFSILKANFGAASAPGVTNAPEPAAIALLTFGGLAVLRRRRR